MTEWAAVVPVAFFTQANVDMTAQFLRELSEEPGLEAVLVQHNGGPLAEEGAKALVAAEAAWRRIRLAYLTDWPFYALWNEGRRWAGAIGVPVLGVLNNDISWERGTLYRIVEALASAPEDVAVASPDYRGTIPPGELVYGTGLAHHNGGLVGWCFFLRMALAGTLPPIDERYQCWCGDTELALQVEEAGYRMAQVGGAVVHHEESSTMRHRPDVEAQRQADRALFDSKWGKGRR